MTLKDLLKLAETTGAIVLAKSLDYETLSTTDKELRFVIRVADTGGSTGKYQMLSC